MSSSSFMSDMKHFIRYYFIRHHLNHYFVSVEDVCNRGHVVPKNEVRRLYSTSLTMKHFCSTPNIQCRTLFCFCHIFDYAKTLFVITSIIILYLSHFQFCQNFIRLCVGHYFVFERSSWTLCDLVCSPHHSSLLNFVL